MKKEIRVMEQIKLLLKSLKAGLKLYTKYEKEIAKVAELVKRYTKPILIALVVGIVLYIVVLQFGYRLVF